MMSREPLRAVGVERTRTRLFFCSRVSMSVYLYDVCRLFRCSAVWALSLFNSKAELTFSYSTAYGFSSLQLRGAQK